MTKKKVAIIASIVIAVILLIAGVSYAYYSANVKEVNKTETVIKTNELTIVYTGTEEINVSGIVPGDNFTKKFTVENTSNVPVTYNIYLEGITNEFNEDLVYTLKDKDGEIIEEEVLPSTNGEKTYLITDIEIDSNELKEYEMTIEFKYSDKDQNKLQGKSFNATLGIDTKPVKIVKVINEKLELDKLSSGDTVTKEFSVKNLSKETQSYDLKLSDVVSTYGDNLTYSLTKNGTEVVSNETMPTSDVTILSTQIINANTIDEYVMTINFDGTTAALEYILAAENDNFSAKLTVLSKDVDPNENIVRAYTYNQTSGASDYCVTGNEETCVETTCHLSISDNSCASGTIVDYKVNDNETVRFHVMYDNGSTLTMQSQKSQVFNSSWINASDYANANTDQTSCSSKACTDEGPITILNTLESATSDWSNVNPQTYTMGKTVFKTNAYTGCYSYNSCGVEKYVLDKKNVNARMITVQEAADLGCTSSNKSCPVWIYNFLQKSKSYGGTANETSSNVNDGYWTMSAYINEYTNTIDTAFYLYDRGSINAYDNITVTVGSYGARAVVEINK